MAEFSLWHTFAGVYWNYRGSLAVIYFSKGKSTMEMQFLEEEQARLDLSKEVFIAMRIGFGCIANMIFAKNKFVVCARN